MGVAHNGNLVNARFFARAEEAGSIFATSSDTETILHLMAGSQQGTFINRLVDGLIRVDGAYSLVLGGGHAVLSGSVGLPAARARASGRGVGGRERDLCTWAHRR